MFQDIFFWSVKRFRPREGWLALALLLVVISSLVSAILDVGWVPEVGVVGITAVSAFCLTYLLAKRAKNSRIAWVLLILYGLLITTIHLANLLPPTHMLRQGFWPLRSYWLRNSNLFLIRSSNWFITVSTGQRSQETLIFAVGLGLATWLLVAYAVWSTIRLQKPLIGLSLMAMALALNGFFGVTAIWYLAIFIGAAALLAASIYYATLEQKWLHQNLDFSTEIRLDMLLYASAIALALLIGSFALPTISIPKIVDAFLNHLWVIGTEQTLGDAFGGVEQPRPRPISPGSAGDAGVMPRAYLLNNPPELSEIVMMEAQVTLENGEVAPPAVASRAHWRGLSFVTYTGRGWALAEEQQQALRANRAVPLPTVAATLSLQQQVTWLRDQRFLRYTLGEPLQFDHDVTLLWHGPADLARVQGEQTTYQIVSRISSAAPNQLRQATLADVPPDILERYTQLPDSLPERVRTLAQEVAGDLDNPFDQARAIELFLRQFPYSLEIEPTPPGQDVVDYFLFDVQSGYCDYYATSMVVLARSLGLPARLAVGFLAQPADETGVQVIRQINGHSWAEVYFAGYGWVEFEPTAPFASPHDTAFPLASGTALEEWYRDIYGNRLASPPLPPRDPVKAPPDWGQILWRMGMVLLLLAGLTGLWVWQRQRCANEAAVVAAYGRFQAQSAKLDQPGLPQQTPAEFEIAFQSHLSQWTTQLKTQEQVKRLSPLATRLSAIFAEHQYARTPEDRADEAKTIWKKMKRPFLLLRLRKKLLK